MKNTTIRGKNMFESWKYPHVPIKGGKLLLYKLPQKYSLMHMTTIKETHVVDDAYKSNNFRGTDSEALCGFTVNNEIHRRQYMHRMCNKCMLELEESLKGTMYDEKNEQLYQPIKQ